MYDAEIFLQRDGAGAYFMCEGREGLASRMFSEDAGSG